MVDHDATAPAARDRGFTVRALGEIAIRCRDLAAMEAFYGEVIGLERLSRRTGGTGAITFFRIGEGYAGHTTVLALFEDPAKPAGHDAEAALHHIALTVGFEEQAGVIAWYERIGRPFRVETFAWIGWRGVFTEDPEGNTVELVAAIPGDAS